MQTSLNIGLVGVGRIASSYIEALRSLEGLELVGLVDTDQFTAAARAAQLDVHGIKVDSSIGALVSRRHVDAFCVCTPHWTHARLAIEALRVGSHVLIEKPVCLTARELGDLEGEANAAQGRVVAVAHQNRHIPLAGAVRSVVRRALGEICHVHLELACHRDAAYYESSPWKGQWNTEGGSLGMNQGIHLVDLLLWMLGPSRRVAAWSSNRWLQRRIETEDSLSGVIEMEAGVLATFNMTGNAVPAFQPRIEFRGTKGVICFEAGFPHRVISAEVDGEFQLTLDQATRRPLVPKKCEKLPPHRLSHFELLSDFAAACRGESSPVVGPQEAFHAVQVVKAMYQSCQEEHRLIEV